MFWQKIYVFSGVESLHFKTYLENLASLQGDLAICKLTESALPLEKKKQKKTKKQNLIYDIKTKVKTITLICLRIIQGGFTTILFTQKSYH